MRRGMMWATYMQGSMQVERYLERKDRSSRELKTALPWLARKLTDKRNSIFRQHSVILEIILCFD